MAVCLSRPLGGRWFGTGSKSYESSPDEGDQGAYWKTTTPQWKPIKTKPKWKPTTKTPRWKPTTTIPRWKPTTTTPNWKAKTTTTKSVWQRKTTTAPKWKPTTTISRTWRQGHDYNEEDYSDEDSRGWYKPTPSPMTPIESLETFSEE